MRKSQKRQGPDQLIFDIETAPVQFWGWRTGDQFVRHTQLVEGHDMTNIICIAYAWNDDPIKIIHWGYNAQDTKSVIERFDKIAEKADIIIGKNSDRFDVKHVSTLRYMHGLPPASWPDRTDDLEKQWRKYFTAQSMSLDYWAKKKLGVGKNPMEFDDWINIVQKRGRAGRESFKKMLEYNIQDVELTRTLWNDGKAYFKPKLNMATFYNDFRCINCGSQNLKKSGTRAKGKTRYQMFFCKEHNGYAGQTPISVTGKQGKIG